MQGGFEAVEPRSRRPKSSPSRTPSKVVAEILEMRNQLAQQGLDAGAQTIVEHLQLRFDIKLSKATGSGQRAWPALSLK